MLETLVDSLNREQRELLHAFGVDSSTLSRWRTGKRLPTEPQAKFLAGLTGADYHKLAEEIVDLRATPEQRKLLERVMGKLQRGAGVTLSFGAVAVAGSVAWILERTTMYRAFVSR